MDHDEARARAGELNLDLFRRALDRRDQAHGSAISDEVEGRLFFPIEVRPGDWEPTLVATEDAGQIAAGLIVAESGVTATALADVDVADQILDQGRALEDQGRPGEAAQRHVEVVALFRLSEDPEVRVRVAAALCQIGYCMEWLGIREVAWFAYAAVVDDFGDDVGDDIGTYMGYASRRLAEVDGPTDKPGDF